MQPIIHSMIQATKKASKLLYRDYCELEFLQTSKNGGIGFAQKAFARTQDILKNDLEKFASNIHFFGEERGKASEVLSLEGNDIYIVPIDAPMNFTRSYIDFGFLVSYFKKGVLEASIINMPVRDEVLYAERGAGARLIRNNLGNSLRLRVSLVKNLADAALLTDNYLDLKNLKILDDVDNRNVRVTGSILANFISTAAGKADLTYFDIEDDLLLQALNLISLESGGAIISYGKGYFFSNAELKSQFGE